jgi:hypothetical protein
VVVFQASGLALWVFLPLPSYSHTKFRLPLDDFLHIEAKVIAC